MPFFCIYDHPKMPIISVRVEPKRRDTDKDGFRLRYIVALLPEAEPHADDVISMIDDLMGPRTKAHGTYQAPYDDVRAAYGGLVESAGGDPDADIDTGFLRACALIAAIGLGGLMCALIAPVGFTFLLVTAFKKQSGFAAMAEAAIIWHILDWRPTIHRLITYALRPQER